MKIGVMSLVIILFSCAFIFPLVLAHQPRIVFDRMSSLDNPIIIVEPEISKAFYGNLNGTPDYYVIDSDTEFELYVNLLSPYPAGNRDFAAYIYSSRDINPLFSLMGISFNWTKFHEEFGGDDYWMGPELDKNVSGGKYIIKIFNSNNSGKYSLATGKIEAFPFKEQIRAFLVMPRLKGEFFNKNPFTAYFNIIGLFFLIALLILVAILWALYKVIRKIINKKRAKNKKKN